MMHCKTAMSIRSFSTSIKLNAKTYKLLVIGGGAGGSSVASKFASKYPKGSVGIIEPEETHYYQALWTLVGGGLKTLDQTAKPMRSVLPKKADWICDHVSHIDPAKNLVVTESGKELKYEYLTVAAGHQLNFNKVKGLLDALQTPYVGSNYSKLYVENTCKGIKNFKGGNALFTFPNSPVKCPGAPQKIAYLADDAWRKMGIRSSANMKYMTSLPAIFGIKRYADVLNVVAKEKGIDVFTKVNLIEVKPDSREAIFENLDKPEEKITLDYGFLHVTPPQSTPDFLSKCTELVDEKGYLSVDKFTLQHNKYKNIFGIGDCINAPNSKTAAAVAVQCGIVRQNLADAMSGKSISAAYNGYASCPLTTGNSKVILAEFGYDGRIMETFPINQTKESMLMYLLKAHAMPTIYWMMTKGFWEGTTTIRKLINPRWDSINQ